jgi:hypothetical protein
MKPIIAVPKFRGDAEWKAYLAQRPEHVRRGLETTGKATVRVWGHFRIRLAPYISRFVK